MNWATTFLDRLVVVGWVQPFSGRAKPTIYISFGKVGSISFHPPYYFVPDPLQFIATEWRR